MYKKVSTFTCRNVWPTLYLFNVFTARQGSHFYTSLEIERGHYMNIPKYQRHGKIYLDEVEDEYHLISRCNV